MMKNILRNAIGFLLSISGVSRFVRMVIGKRKVAMLIYHHPEADVFEQHVQFLAARYNIISFQQFYTALAQRDFSSLPDRSLVITVDDGHRSNIELLPILKQYDVPMMIYLCSQIVATNRGFWWQSKVAEKLGVTTLKELPNKEREEMMRRSGFDKKLEYGTPEALDLAQIKRLKSYCEYGAHTQHHPILPRCDEQEAEQEIAAGKEDLEVMLGHTIDHFAFPNGDYTERDIELVKQAGFKTSRTTNVGWNTEHTDPYRLNIFPVYDKASVWWLRVQLMGVTKWLP